MIIHGTAVDVGGRAVLILGESGVGKSLTALHMISGGLISGKKEIKLIADDCVKLSVAAAADNNGDGCTSSKRERGIGHCHIVASPPKRLEGLIELRHVAILEMDFSTNVPVELAVILKRSDSFFTNEEKDKYGMASRQLQPLRGLLLDGDVREDSRYRAIEEVGENRGYLSDEDIEGFIYSDNMFSMEDDNVIPIRKLVFPMRYSEGEGVFGYDVSSVASTIHTIMQAGKSVFPY